MSFEIYFATVLLITIFAFSSLASYYFLVTFVTKVRSRFSLWRIKRRRHRAARGLVLCTYQDCKDAATYVTPNGYYCDWHWEPMSKRRFAHGGYVTWAHKLDHAIRRN